jgi:predicted metal-dependent hydrolase
MNSNFCLSVNGIEVSVIRKPIKNLHLSVMPPNGWVRVTAPDKMKDEVIKALLAVKLRWIKKQQAKFECQERQTEREYVAGESHYFLGKRYRLEVIFKDAKPSVFLRGNNKIILQVRHESSKSVRQEVMYNWYREELFLYAGEVIAEWEGKIGVKAEFFGIKRMRTRWGSCNHEKRRIWLNLELAKKPVNCIEYVIVHELIHIITKKHDNEFFSLMDKYLPNWKSMKEELNRFMLSDEKWSKYD